MSVSLSSLELYFLIYSIAALFVAKKWDCIFSCDTHVHRIYILRLGQVNGLSLKEEQKIIPTNQFS